jgi:hypothetical protein
LTAISTPASLAARTSWARTVALAEASQLTWRRRTPGQVHEADAHAPLLEEAQGTPGGL